MTEHRPMGRPPHYPWRTMEVGESFLADPKYTTTSSFGTCCAGARERTGLGFASRQVEVDGQPRVQVTRTR